MSTSNIDSATDELTHKPELLACDGCDLLIRFRSIAIGSRAKCPRCGHVLYYSVENTVDKTLALAISGLILFFPAILLPVLVMKWLSNSQSESILLGITTMFEHGYWWVALIVLSCSILIPFIKIILLIYISAHLKFNLSLPGVATSFRYYHYLDQWGMLEIYLLGILVSIIKLKDMSEVIPGLGFYCLIGLILITVLQSRAIDCHTLWLLIEKRKTEKHER